MPTTRSSGQLQLSWILSVSFLAGLESASAQSSLRGWGAQAFDSAWNGESFAAIAAGAEHTLARRSDGSLAAWGNNQYGQCDVPALPA